MRNKRSRQLFRLDCSAHIAGNGFISLSSVIRSGSCLKPPLVTAPTFAGVFWANFLGPGHLADFDVAKIQSIEAYRTKWHGKTGLSLVSAPTLDDALTPDGEKELLRLTAEFRAAKVD